MSDMVAAHGDETKEDHTAEDSTQDDEASLGATITIVETIVEILMQQTAGCSSIVHPWYPIGN